MLNGGSMIWGFCVYFVYMIPLETDVLRKHRFQKSTFQDNFLGYLAHPTAPTDHQFCICVYVSDVVLTHVFSTVKQINLPMRSKG